MVSISRDGDSQPRGQIAASHPGSSPQPRFHYWVFKVFSPRDMTHQLTGHHSTPSHQKSVTMLTLSDTQKTELPSLLSDIDAKVIFHCGDEDSREAFSVTLDGRQTHVDDYTPDSWDFLMIALSAGQKRIALIEVDDVYEVHSAIQNLKNAGLTYAEAISALLED